MYTHNGKLDINYEFTCLSNNKGSKYRPISRKIHKNNDL